MNKKSVQTYKTRTECFSSQWDKIEEEMHKVKQLAERWLAALKQKHQVDVAHEHTLLFKMKQYHIKVVSASLQVSL
jgi:hypothetical protein